MLQHVIKEIVERFNVYLALQGGNPAAPPFPLVAEDISKQNNQSDDTSNNGVQNSLVLTLSNIEEETSLKNNYPKQQQGTTVITKRPALHINLYLLFAAYFDKYDEALKQLSYVLQFFQINPRMSFTNSLTGESFELYFNIHNLGYENMNNLWVVMGGSYLPSVLYKCRLVVIQKSVPSGGPTITEVNTSGENIL